MSLRRTVGVIAFIAASALSTGVVGAEGKWTPARDWNGHSPGTFKTQCETSGGDANFDSDKGLWSCTSGGGTAIYCDQGSDVKSTNCRRHTPTKFPRPQPGTTYQQSEDGVFTDGVGGSPGNRVAPSSGAAIGGAVKAS